ncbi:MAG: 3-hydroxyacyl-ACP dehydratase FabZ family protein, partial [Gemmataceae bacterium]
MIPEPILDPLSIDFTQVLADREGLRRHNPQRFEMEQVDAVVLMDQTEHIVVGYKEVRPDEFWCKGHMPDYPLMPGVLMCEAAAQLVSYYIVHIGVLKGDFIGFGGMEEVRFRGVVRPGDRLVLMGKGIRVDRRQSRFLCQAFVGSNLVFHGIIIGVP